MAFSEDGKILPTLYRQLGSLYEIDDVDKEVIEQAQERAMARVEFCFSRIRNKYYSDADGNACFDRLHGCHWAAYLYFLSNEIYRMGGGVVCDKIYALLRMLSSADLFYQVELPDVFAFDHPLGAVMGRAQYSDYFTFSQGCTVGNNNGVYPTFGKSVFMLSDSKVLGNCRIGDNVIIGAGAYVKDTDIPAGSIVFGQSPNLVVKESRLEYVQEYAYKVFRYE